MFKRAIPKPTPDQQSRQDKCRAAGCIACKQDGTYFIAWAAQIHPEIHHLTVSGRQIGQDATVCLCSWHHRGICVPNARTSEMERLYGPSLAKGSKTFHARYGSNDELLAYQAKVIGEEDANLGS